MSKLDKEDLKQIAEAARGVGDSDLGSGLGIMLALIAFPLGFAFILAAVTWDGHFYDQKGCWQLQEIKGKAFNVNTCTGETKPFKLEQTK